MPASLMAKLFGAIIVSLLFLSPVNTLTQQNKPPTENSNMNLENAQLLADKTGKPVKVWMDKTGHVLIEPADQKPIAPYTIYHSTWVPRKK